MIVMRISQIKKRLRFALNQDKVSQWNYLSTCRLLFQRSISIQSRSACWSNIKQISQFSSKEKLWYSSHDIVETNTLGVKEKAQIYSTLSIGHPYPNDTFIHIMYLRDLLFVINRHEYSWINCLLMELYTNNPDFSNLIIDIFLVNRTSSFTIWSKTYLSSLVD
jgi:hypothetical protein